MKKSIRITIVLTILVSLLGIAPVHSVQAIPDTSSNWSALGSIPVNGQVSSIAISGSGDVYVASNFSAGMGWPRTDMIAKWDGSSWSFLGTTSLNGSIHAIAINEMDEIYIGGIFTNAGGDPNADYIAKWNGSSWSSLGTTPLPSTRLQATYMREGGFTNAGGDPNADYIARKAINAPKANGAEGDTRFHKRPASTLAGNAMIPTEALYNPYAAPRFASGTSSATIAFAAPSVNA